MSAARQTAIPTLVRVKPGALDRLGIYARRHGLREVAVISSHGLVRELSERALAALDREGVRVGFRHEAEEIELEAVARLFLGFPPGVQAVVGLGGGKALDVAKYAAFLAGLPFFAVPTSLSNDGFCSPQASLTTGGRRRSLRAASAFAVVVDTSVCLAAPKILWLSGVGDLAAKFTAVTDWKLAFHAVDEPVDDFAALLSDASVYQFVGRPGCDLEGTRLLGTALMLNGIAMAICGSSRPASGSEHLISHALDAITTQPRLHGLQVGVATYLCSILQGRQNTETILGLFEATGFSQAIAEDPFCRAEWLEAARMAPHVKKNFYTILSAGDQIPTIAGLLEEDPFLRRCFR